jgi:phospholipase C
VANDFKKIEHLIILMLENRSFDHYLGSLSLEGRRDIEGRPPAGFANPDTSGNAVRSWDMQNNFCGYADPPHGWLPQHANAHGGQNDGFVKSYQAAYPTGQSAGAPPLPAPANLPMGYYTRETLPILYALADQFTVCDHWFSAVLSSTWPNRKYLHSGCRDGDNDTQTLPPFPGFETTPFCDFLEEQRDPDTGQRLTWRTYFSDLPFLAFWYKFAAFHALDNFASVDQFVLDCREDRLPTISFIDPPFSLADDHPSHDVRLGQKFIGLIVDALTNSESWAKSALVLLYDENGGFYDHVPPPPSFEAAAGVSPAPDDPLGFRVPAVVISPYARRGQTAKTAFDHTSIMKSISLRWSVDFPEPTFGPRWRRAPSIWADGFDFTQPPLAMGTYTQPPADTQAGKRPPFADLNWASGIHEALASPLGTLEGLLERIFLLPSLKVLDHRARVYEHLQAMEQHVITLKRMS